MSKMVRRLALTALAFALLVPAAAHAKGFEVSRDIGVYAGPTTKSKGIGTIRARQLAQVECWTTGQPVLGYSIWDRVKYRGLTGYVHDKYVEMGGSHKDNGIENCKDAAQSDPDRCVGRTESHYLARIFPVIKKGVPQGWDSWYRLKWTVAFCPRGKGDYVVSGTPEIREYPSINNGLSLVKALDLQVGEAHPTPDGRKVVYNPRLMICLPGKFPGACATYATMRVMARLQGKRARIDRSVVTTGLGRAHLHGEYLGWRGSKKPKR
jgi:uncharacterized protein YraI